MVVDWDNHEEVTRWKENNLLKTDYTPKTAEYAAKHALKSQQARRRRTQAAFDRYGWSCICCGESNPKFLTLDHIHNDGAEHRRSIGLNRTQLIGWLKRHGWPDNVVQVMCFNCNCGRAANGGICPHTETSIDTETRVVYGSPLGLQ